MHITLTYQWEPGPLRRASLAIVRRPRIVFWVLTAVYALGGVVLLIAGATAGGTILVAAGGAFALWLQLAPRRTISKHAARWRGPIRLILTDTHFALENELERGEIRWAAVVKIRSTSEAFLLHRGPRLATVVPKSAFDPVQLSEFTAFATHHNASKQLAARR